MSSTMTDAARRVLHVAILRYEQEAGPDSATLPLDGWEHYSTGTTDEGISTFGYDRADGRSLYVTVGNYHGPTIDRERSSLFQPPTERSSDE